MQKELRLRDFYLAAYLTLEKYPLLGTERHNGITSFVFEDTESLQGKIKSYYNMDAKADPLLYSSQIRTLKTVVHQNSNSKSNSEEIKYGTNYKFNSVK